MYVGSHYCAVNEIRTRAGIKERGQPTANCVKSESALTWVVVMFSGSDVSNSLWPHRLQHVRLPCLSPTRRVCSNSCPLSQWCHLTFSSSVIPFSFCWVCLNMGVLVCIRIYFTLRSKHSFSKREKKQDLSKCVCWGWGENEDEWRRTPGEVPSPAVVPLLELTGVSFPPLAGKE